MSASFQKTYLLGNIVRDIELRYLKTGAAVANFSIAVGRSWKGEDGQRHEETTFFDCTAFGRTAEIASEYLRRGSPIFLEGRFKNESWQDKQTQQKRSKLVLIIENLQLLGDKSGQNRQPKQPAVPKQSAPTKQTAASSASNDPGGETPF
jgi:single-strand DNA-binding protein